MSNEQQYGGNTNETEKIIRDESLDILSLMNDKEDEDTVSEVTPSENKDINVEMTPLRKMLMEKENQQSGLVVTKEQMEKGKGPTRLKTMLEDDDRVDAITHYANDMDKQSSVMSNYLVPKPNNDTEMAQLMQAVDEITTTGQIQTHNAIADQIIKKPADYEANKEKYTELTSSETVSNKPVESNANTEETKNDELSDEDERKKRVQVLIDKTGFGAADFTPEEREKMEVSDEIQIIRVKKEELESIQYAKPIPQNSFQSIMQQYQLDSSSTPIIFPCSRFRARLNGLSYGELSDISLNPETQSVEDARRRMSVIYNKMSSTNVSPFKDFNDFLHKFAFEDLQLAIFALVVSTFPEEEEVDLVCGNKKCPGSYTDADGNFVGTPYTKAYSPRTLINYSKCGEAMIEWTEKLADMSGTEAEEAFKHSPIQEYITIKLPHSGFILELSRLSCYDFLNEYQEAIKFIEEKYPQFNEADVTEGGIGTRDFTMALILLPIMQYVRSISVKNKDGEYVKFFNGRDIAEAITAIDSYDMKVLSSIIGDVDDYSVSFVIRDCKCPKCGHVQEELELPNLDQLVFSTYQQQMNSEINTLNSVRL